MKAVFRPQLMIILKWCVRAWNAFCVATLFFLVIRVCAFASEWPRYHAGDSYWLSAPIPRTLGLLAPMPWLAYCCAPVAFWLVLRSSAWATDLVERVLLSLTCLMLSAGLAVAAALIQPHIELLVEPGPYPAVTWLANLAYALIFFGALILCGGERKAA